VLVQPGDSGSIGGFREDDRWRSDVHASSRMVDNGGPNVLSDFVAGDITVHDGALEGTRRIARLLRRSRAGEVFVDGKKAVA